MVNSKESDLPSNSNTKVGQAGKFRTLHDKLPFTTCFNDASISVPVTTDPSLDVNSVVITSNIPIDKDTVGNKRYVITSRVSSFEVSMRVRYPQYYFAVIDLVYQDNKELVHPKSQKHHNMHLLENQNISRFESSSPDASCEFNSFIETKACFSVRIRETTRLHKQKEKRKSLDRPFCFRLTIFKADLSCSHGCGPTVDRVFVADSVSFLAVERKPQRKEAQTSTRQVVLSESTKKRGRKQSISDEDDEIVQEKKKVKVQHHQSETVQQLSSICDEDLFFIDESLRGDSFLGHERDDAVVSLTPNNGDDTTNNNNKNFSTDDLIDTSSLVDQLLFSDLTSCDLVDPLAEFDL